MKVIVPCAGKSSRFSETRPKWMLTHPDGNLMVKKALEGLRGIEKKDIIITILKEHEEKYNISRGLRENIGEEITILTLDEPTRSQSETVYLTLKKAGVTGGFLVKDSDNYFEVDVPCENNYICYSNLDEYSEINPSNKSYIKMNEQGVIVDMVEKRIISKYFNVGGYFFRDAKKFFETFEKLSRNNNLNELYLSYIIEDMILNQKDIFLGKKVEKYLDWGTFEDWIRYTKKFKTYFFDLDGILFKNGSQFFNPRWEETGIIENNAKFIKELSESEYSQIFFVTSRPEKYRNLVENKLKELGIKFAGVIMGCLHAKRKIINDFSKTNGYPSCESISVPRDSENLRDYI